MATCRWTQRGHPAVRAGRFQSAGTWRQLAGALLFRPSVFEESIAQHGGRLFCIHTSQQEVFFATVKPDLVLFCEDHEPHSQEQEIDNANKANHATNFSLQVDGATKTKPCYGLQPIVDDGKT